ncbi:hypothetical protein [Caldicellulosiruptor bescii]|nr:hypothetical protein [Caldicellulosiruptor bescii]
MERRFIAFVSHDVAMYLVEKCEDGCKVVPLPHSSFPVVCK